jgi:unsaturated rhamnogalacturonyl hydrolase
MKNYKTIFFIFFFLCQFVVVQDCFSQQEAKKEMTVDANAPVRQPLELMKMIAGNLVKYNPLEEGGYVKGDWEAVEASKPAKVMWWLYPTGVSLLALQRVYDITQDDRLLKFVNEDIRISANEYAYLRWQKNKFGTIKNSSRMEKMWRLDMLDDYGAISAAILDSKLRRNATFTPQVKELIDITASYIIHKQYRLPDKSLWRPNSPDGPTIWADDLFMGLPFLIRLSEYKNDPAIMDDAVQQILNYAGYLQDTDGVWFHAYFVDKKRHSCCKWGRANGWVAVAIAEVLSQLPRNHPRYNEVMDIYKKLINGVIRYQSNSGLWFQVIDHPELTWGEETSCSAQFTYAIARGINRGWLDNSYLPAVTNAYRALADTSRISAAGDILKVCESTSIGNDLEYYNNRRAEGISTDHHGDGLVLLAITEMYNVMQKKSVQNK